MNKEWNDLYEWLGKTAAEYLKTAAETDTPDWLRLELSTRADALAYVRERMREDDASLPKTAVDDR